MGLGNSGAAVFAAVFIALLVAHTVADHWVQTAHQAMNKGRRGRVGALACLRHVATYTTTTAVFGLVVWQFFGLGISVTGFVAGQVVSAATHYWADRRFTLAWLAGACGKSDLYSLGFPRPGCDDNPSLGTGSYAIDQSFHWFWLLVAALLTSTI
jgi:Protein of unknown function (DUF3307)